MLAAERFPSCTRPCSAGIVLLLSVKSGDAARTKALLHPESSSGSSSDLVLMHPDETRDARGYTALHLASIHGHFEIARALVTAGASTESVVTSGVNEGLTPLRLAAERGHRLTVRVLLEAGADTAAEDVVDHATPLHAAASAGHTSVVTELIWGGANLEARAVSGQTPLRWALSMGRVDTVKVLLKAGADPDAPDRRGACCLHTVAALKSEDGCGYDTEEGYSSSAHMAQLLLSSGAAPNLGLRGRGLRRSHPGCVPSASVTVEDGELSGGSHDVGGIGSSSRDGFSEDESPLHVAARESNAKVAEVLLLHGADPNAKTRTEGGMSPLHCASSRTIVHMLLKAGADIGPVSADGQTSPLKLACLNAAVGCVQELLLWGADDVSFVPRRTPPFTSLSCLPSSLPLVAVASPSCPSNMPASDFDAVVEPINIPRLRDLVGSRVPASIRDATDCEKILRMLCQAPADRAWRRRGWLVMLYTRKTTADDSASDLQELVPPQQQWLPLAKRERVAGKETVTGCENAHESRQMKFRDVVGCLFGVQGDQSVFRRVVEWL